MSELYTDINDAMLDGTVRIVFEKRGSLKFISHLDLQRTVKTALIRARIPLWYTEGFNPRPKLVFALPLSIGSESVREFLDIRFTSPMARSEIISRIDGAFSEELNVFDAYTPDRKFSDIGWAEYKITSDTLDCMDMGKVLSGQLMVTKHSKSGGKTFDIIPMIRSYTHTGKSLILTLCADCDNYLNPDNVAQAIGLEDYAVLRTNVFCRDGVTEFR